MLVKDCHRESYLSMDLAYQWKISEGASVVSVFLNSKMTACDGLLGVLEVHELDSGVSRKQCGTEMLMGSV